ncbi:hypothetical protein CL614_06460 [archaeon]|nr:hypothetical protein [archaeon]|tara:strand:+ start:454 stop:990 length:537 start_codon:yes stop_codon:yes gene_type:complete
MSDKKRPSKDQYYLDIAKEVSYRATCLRRRYGAIIVKDDQIISTGYVGAPRGSPNCIDIGTCHRQKLNVPKGQRYELCRSVHAEMNAIINAARAGVSLLGGTLYLYGEDIENNCKLVEAGPCVLCKRAIINAGIERVVLQMPGHIKEISIDDWINDVDAEVTSDVSDKGDENAKEKAE